MSAQFFAVTDRQYTNFSVNASTLSLIILAICIGIVLAAAYMFYQKNVPGGIVRKILAAKAHSEQDAKTAEELGLSTFSERELHRNVTLRRLVHSVSTPAPAAQGDEEVTDETSIAAPERYYIPEEEKYRAEARYENAGNGLVGFLITVGMTILLGFLLTKLLPVFLGLVDNLFGRFQ